MKRVSILLVGLSLIALPVAAQTKGSDKDQEAIKSISLKWQDSWNRHDMKALTELVAEDVAFITVAGNWRKNRKEFEEHHTNARHEMQYKESVWTTKHTEVKFIRSDVAVAHVEWGIKGDKDPDGTPRQPRQGISTWVLEKRNGKWLIVATHNTNLREPVSNK
ncbi:MAG: SgcJ/EcaC family oxidoreductase [Pyrinomonadaceae bacterium]|nr:SgcJ/EcaC family oxidoreductase [Pyrinomonadaceae bacterium]